MEGEKVKIEIADLLKKMLMDQEEIDQIILLTAELLHKKEPHE